MRKLLPWIVVLMAAAGVGTGAPPAGVPLAGAPSAGDGPETGVLDDDERLVESAGLSSEGPGLVEFFRGRARNEAESGRIDDLVRRFCGNSPEERVQAGAGLVAMGPLAINGLRRIVNDFDVNGSRDWARQCLEWVEGPKSAGLVSAAARLVARRRPAGAAEALLAYLPYADNEEIAREVAVALRAVAMNGDQPDPALVKALSDPIALRRAAAGAALSQTPAEHQAIEKLLEDANPEVRLTSALSLAKARNAAAIPVLIDLVAVLPVAKRAQVEEVLQELAGEWAPTGGPTGEDEIARKIRRDAWNAWWTNTEGPALIKVLAKHTLTPAETEKVKDAIRRLSDKTYAVREKAVTELVGRGRKILPMLREAVKENDLEMSKRAQRCIERIEQEPANRLPSAALRLLALRKPDGAGEALLSYLPFAESDYVEELRSALALVAQRDGKPDAALLRALTSPEALLRGAAGEALAQNGGPDARPAVRKLLADDNQEVRYRTALALAPKDAQAVPTLIELIAKVRDEQAARIHEFLSPLAGDKGPAAPEDTVESRKKCSAAWATWWEANSAKADLAKLSRPTHEFTSSLGFVVIAEHNTGNIVELDRNRKPRWSFGGTRNPVDAWVLPNNRVVVSEYGANLVTMRDLKGKVLWQKQMNGSPHNIQVLPSGNVFIGSNVHLAEVDRNGKDVPFPLGANEVQQLANNLGQFTGAYKMRNGHYVIMGSNGQCIRLDAKGQQVKSFNTNRGNAWLDVTPNGRIIMATNGSNKIAEYDLEGKMLVELDVPQVSMVTGIPNGNFLVASHGTGQVWEMDRKGKTLWEHKTNGPFRARWR